MRKISSLLLFGLMALIAVASIGCDSNDDDTADAAKFEGMWALTSVSDDEGDATATFVAAFQSIVLDNATDDTFDLTVTPQTGDPIVLSGTYSVNESSKKFTLVAQTPLGPASLNFTYAFDGDNKVVLTSDTTTALLLNTLFEGVDLVGQAVITVTRVT